MQVQLNHEQTDAILSALERNIYEYSRRINEPILKSEYREIYERERDKSKSAMAVMLNNAKCESLQEFRTKIAV